MREELEEQMVGRRHREEDRAVAAPTARSAGGRKRPREGTGDWSVPVRKGPPGAPEGREGEGWEAARLRPRPVHHKKSLVPHKKIVRIPSIPAHFPLQNSSKCDTSGATDGGGSGFAHDTRNPPQPPRKSMEGPWIRNG